MAEKKSNAAKEREIAQKAKDSLPERDSYTAKQVATRCGTDAKTLRKFLRSPNSTAEAVGQGGRYEFDADDLPLIQKEFAIWRKKAEARKSSPAVVTTPIPKKPAPKPAPPTPAPPVDDPDAVWDEDEQEWFAAPGIDDDDEPTAEELAALENEEFDDEELSA